MTATMAMTATTADKPVRAFIALGANLGEPLAQLDSATAAINQHPQIVCLRMSRVYGSKPHGPQDQPDFTNAVLEINTTLSAEQLLDVLQEIEQQHGRVRHEHWGARTLDLDILLFGNQIIATPRLTIPHPRAGEREFVIQPLADLDDKLNIPNQGNVGQLLQQLPIETMEIIRDVTTDYRKTTER